MVHEIIRSYRPIVERILNLPCANKIGETSSGYPLFQATLYRSVDAPNVLISGGVHGREPAGTYAVLQFFERTAKEGRYPNVNFFAFPCVNPWGFERDIREKEDGVDINRQFFDGTAAREVKAIFETLAHGAGEYIFSMDMHETSQRDDPDCGPLPMTYYMWELRASERQSKLGGLVIDAVREAGHETCNWDEIYEDHNNGGVIHYPEDAHSEVYAKALSFDAYLLKKGFAKRAFTTETPTSWSMEKRVDAHIIALETVLEVHR